MFLQTSVSENWRLGNVNTCPTCKRKKKERQKKRQNIMTRCDKCGGTMKKIEKKWERNGAIDKD